MPRHLPLALLVLLSSALLGGTCSDSKAVPLEELQKDSAPSFDYSLYCDAHGTLVGERSGTLLAYRSEHLERVYADSLSGDPRAQVLIRQLDDTLRLTGAKLAREAHGLVCNSLPACVVRWQMLDEFIPSRGPGGMHLRQALAEGFAKQAKSVEVSNTVLSAALDVLMVGSALKLGTAGATSSQTAVSEAQAALAETGASSVEAGSLAVAGLEMPLAAQELPALEARLAEEEAREVSLRHPARLDELARSRPSSSQPPSGVEADNPRWTSYVAYWNRRYDELAGMRPLPPGQLEAKPPLTWKSYSALLDEFQRSLAFQRGVGQELRQEASSSARSRRMLPDMRAPLITDNTGLKLEGRTNPVYVDHLAVDEATLGTGRRPSVHTFSDKQHSFEGKSIDDARSLLSTDIREALAKYSGTVEVRRPGHPLFGQKVQVSQVHLVYDGTGLSDRFMEALSNDALDQGVHLHFHVP